MKSGETNTETYKCVTHWTGFVSSRAGIDRPVAISISGFRPFKGWSGTRMANSGLGIDDIPRTADALQVL